MNGGQYTKRDKTMWDSEDFFPGSRVPTKHTHTASQLGSGWANFHASLPKNWTN